jgi:hypothetical protein
MSSNFFSSPGPEAPYILNRHLSDDLKALPWKIAAPSWVRPGSLAANCRLLQGSVEEAALLFLESEACLAYGESDLPSWLAGLELSYHLHLPVDLPWERGARDAWDVVERLMRKTEFLSPSCSVLHAPETEEARQRELLEAFLEMRDRRRPGELLLLENTGAAGPEFLSSLTRGRDAGLCLDLGHLLAYEQRPPGAAAMEAVGMFHLSAPGPAAEHLSLAGLDEAGKEMLRTMLQAADESATVTLEVFDEQALAESARLLVEWSRLWGLA